MDFTRQQRPTGLSRQWLGQQATQGSLSSFGVGQAPSCASVSLQRKVRITLTLQPHIKALGEMFNQYKLVI